MASINATHINPPEKATRADIFDEESEMLRTKRRCLLERSFG
jgi:hypothetical protein